VKRWLAPLAGLLFLDALALHDVLVGEAPTSLFGALAVPGQGGPAGEGDLRLEAAVLGLSLVAYALFIVLVRRGLVSRETAPGAKKRE